MIAPVVRLEAVGKHPNADRLEIGHLSNGVNVVTGAHYEAGVLGVYIPPGSWLPGWLADDMWLFGFATACQRWFEVREIELRGIKSPGLFAGSRYRKDKRDKRSKERFDLIKAAGGRGIAEDWIEWHMWRPAWREGDDAGIYLGIVPDAAWDHLYGMGPPKIGE